MTEVFFGDNPEDWDNAFKEMLSGMEGELSPDSLELRGELAPVLGAEAVNVAGVLAQTAEQEDNPDMPHLERLHWALQSAVTELDTLSHMRFYEPDSIPATIGPMAKEIIYRLLAVNDNDPIEIEVSGPGVVCCDAVASFESSDDELDEDSDETSFVLRNVTIKSNDPLAVRRGFFRGDATVNVAVVDEDTDAPYYTPAIVLRMDSPRGATPLTVGIDDIRTILFELIPKHYTAAFANSDVTKFEIPKYRQLVDCNAALGKLAEAYPQAEQLPAQLSELQELVIAAGDVDYTELADISLLQNIVKAVEGDEQLADRVAMILEDILKHRPIVVEGDFYDYEGDLTKDVNITNMVRAVITTAPGVPAGQLYIVFNNSDDGVHNGYIPLSSITKMWY